jgi:hypothetical protein
VGDESISLHGEGDCVILTKEDGTREEVDLAATGKRADPEEEPPPPGTSPLDEDLERLADTL